MKIFCKLKKKKKNINMQFGFSNRRKQRVPSTHMVIYRAHLGLPAHTPHIHQPRLTMQQSPRTHNSETCTQTTLLQYSMEFFIQKRKYNIHKIPIDIYKG